MKKSTILIFSFFVIVIAFSMIRGGIHPFQKAKNKNKFTWTIAQDYLDLFTPEMQKQFVATGVLGTITTPSGVSVSSISYVYEEDGKGRSYEIELFKAALMEDKPLDEIIQVKGADSIERADTGFTDLSSGGFALKLKPGKNVPVSHLTWDFKGDKCKPVLKRDSLLYYEVRFNYFTLKFDNGTEFWAKKTPVWFFPVPSPSSGKFIFIKKKNNLYMLFFEDVDFSFLKPNDVLKTINPNLVSPNGNIN